MQRLMPSDFPPEFVQEAVEVLARVDELFAKWKRINEVKGEHWRKLCAKWKPRNSLALAIAVFAGDLGTLLDEADRQSKAGKNSHEFLRHLGEARRHEESIIDLLRDYGPAMRRLLVLLGERAKVLKT
jgi:hypothetical protein